MTLETAVATYGYPVLFLGAMLEGETAVILAGFLAHRGYLQLPWVIAAAGSAAYLSDQMFFRLGRHKGMGIIDKYPQAAARIDRLRNFFERHPLAVIFSYRFMYGLQKLTPVFIGMSRFSPARFAAATLFSAALWATVVSSAGYFFGGALQALLDDARRYELPVVLLIIGSGLVLLLFRRRRSRRVNGSGNCR